MRDLDINLCASCVHDFATCSGDCIFACDVGGKSWQDNVVDCSLYTTVNDGV